MFGLSFSSKTIDGIGRRNAACLNKNASITGCNLDGSCYHLKSGVSNNVSIEYHSFNPRTDIPAADKTPKLKSTQVEKESRLTLCFRSKFKNI